MTTNSTPKKQADKRYLFATGLWHVPGNDKASRSRFISTIKERSARIFGDGDPQPITNTSVSDLVATEIVYLYLSVSSDLQYNYLVGSGVYRKSPQPASPPNPAYPTVSEDEVQAFARAVVQTNVPSSGFYLFNLYQGSVAPGFVLKYPCFVIVQLVGPPGMHYLPDNGAIEMLGSTAGNPANFYTDLQHLGADNVFYNAAPPNTTCNLFYVGALKPYSDRPDDNFNYYIQYVQSGDTIIMTLDPCIKNQGTDPGFQSKKPKRRRRR